MNAPAWNGDDTREFGPMPSQLAGPLHAGRHCARCREEVQACDDVYVDTDGDEDGGWYVVVHVECPEEQP